MTLPRTASKLGNGNASASVPDFFQQYAHDLYVIGALYRAAGDTFNRALNNCADRNNAKLANSVNEMRKQILAAEGLALSLENKIFDHQNADNWQDSPQVYGS